MSRVAARPARRRASVDFPEAIFPQRRYKVGAGANSIRKDYHRSTSTKSPPDRAWRFVRARSNDFLRRECIIRQAAAQGWLATHCRKRVRSPLRVILRPRRPLATTPGWTRFQAFGCRGLLLVLSTRPKKLCNLADLVFQAGPVFRSFRSAGIAHLLGRNGRRPSAPGDS